MNTVSTGPSIALGVIALVVVASLVLPGVMIAGPMLERYRRHKDED